ncbi:MAG: phosphodiester glycosidase family protein, partial [Oscillospiraceae bacterium]|nr:phosphodiester glycosidase family protein [Oscillospiraceae bacterium]
MSTIILSALLLMSWLCVPSAAAGGGTGEAVYSNTSELLPGYSFINEVSYDALGQRQETSVLTVSADSPVRPMCVTAPDIYSGASIDEVISYYMERDVNVVGAVNADFFGPVSKNPLGIAIEDGIFKSSPEDENILGFGPDGPFFLPKTQITLTLTNIGGSFLAQNRGKSFTFTHFNKGRNDYGGLYLMNDQFGSSTHTVSEGWAVRLKRESGKYGLRDAVSFTVVDVIPSGTDFVIGDNMAVLTSDKLSRREDVLKSFTVGDKVLLTFQCSDLRLKRATNATGCGDLLVNNGQITSSILWDKDIYESNPRTAFGVKADGTMVFYTLDGRQKSRSVGCDLLALAQDLKDMGCTFAVNLDGGGSTALSYHRPADARTSLATSPSFGYNRICGSYILLVSEAENTGLPRHLASGQEGRMVLAGSTIDLNLVAADDTLSPAPLPEDVLITSDTHRIGYVTRYTVPDASGRETLLLSSSSSGASGLLHLHVIAPEETTIMLIDASTGREPALGYLDRGAEVVLCPSISYCGKSVFYSDDQPIFAVSDSVGYIDEDNTLVVTGNPGVSGTLSFRLGNHYEEFTVTVVSHYA